MAKTLTYADSGVDIDKGNRFVTTVKQIAQKTFRAGVMGDIGGFGGMFSLNVSGMDMPVLVSATDGVGTKLKIAFLMDKHDTIGIDLVAMCVNDIAVQGAKPLFFLDYLSMGCLNTATATAVIEGIGEGCRQAKCALIGGETAEMPGMYAENEYDLAGFSVGMVDNRHIVDGSEIGVGHQLIGIAANGVHSNGYSLVRKICFDLLKLTVDSHVPDLGTTLGEALLRPTRIYSEIIQSVLRDFPIHGLAHITGGGIAENIIRVIPKACNIAIYRDSWEVPPIFNFLQSAGNIEFLEMMRTFNNGIGMVLIVPEPTVQELLERLTAMDEKVFVIGEVLDGKGTDDRVVWQS